MNFKDMTQAQYYIILQMINNDVILTNDLNDEIQEFKKELNEYIQDNKIKVYSDFIALPLMHHDYSTIVLKASEVNILPSLIGGVNPILFDSRIYMLNIKAIEECIYTLIKYGEGNIKHLELIKDIIKFKTDHRELKGIEK